jgi:DNA-binding MarR family transcriptional regulator
MATERKAIYSVRSIVAMFREFEQAAKHGEMSLTQYRFMLFLRNGPKRAGAIAARSFVTKATVSGQITALREKGWIAVDSDGTDRRVSRVVLTDEGRSVMDAFEARLLTCLETLIGEADKPAILGALGDLYVALGATRESRFGQPPANEDAA